jgi:DNA-binding CsgD family transcriptional regulator
VISATVRRPAALGLLQLEDGEHPLVAIGQVQLVEDPGHVVLHGALPDAEELRDAAVGHALRGAGEHLALPRRQRFQGVGHRLLCHEIGDDVRVHRDPAAVDPVQGVAQPLGVGQIVFEQVADPGRPEVEVLQLVADGQSNKEIGDALSLSPLSVKSSLSRIGRKLGAGDRAQMVALAMRAGVIR